MRMSFPQVRTTVYEFPSTILYLLGIEVPPTMAQPNEELIKRFTPSSIVLIMIDNFGLFEAVVYKPDGLIKNLEALALIETDNPYAIPLIKTILNSGGQSGFHLIDHAKRYGKFTKIICRSDDTETFGFDPAYTVTVRDDMATYVESTKHIAQSELLYLHFLDFESLYAQYGHRTPPEQLLEKIVRRTDNWIKVLMRQSRENTLFVIVGNHGRHEIPLDYEGKLAEWRKANAPIAIMFQKREE